MTSRPAPATAFGVLGSLVVHGALFFYVGLRSSTPDLDIEFQLPSEVEFGLTEGMTVESGVTGAEPVEPEAAPEPLAETAEGEGVVDAGPRRRRDAGAPRDAGARDGGVDAGDLVASAEGEPGTDGPGTGVGGEGDGTTELPPGAQLAIRIDMERIRRSPLAGDVRQLLAEIPDWQVVLDGSGIEPVDDLERVMIASPNLQRSRMLLAGRYEGDVARVREMVDRMAAARGVTAEWRTEHGVPVAPWPDADDTERVIALVGPRHFTITRPEDLPRLLAVARVRAEEERREAQGDGPEQEPAEREPTGADALLSMPDGAALTFEIESAREFMRGARGVPARGRVVVNERPASGAELVVTGEYDSREQAEEAREFWDRVRLAYADNVFVRMLGVSRPLETMELTVSGTELRARTTLSQAQLRLGIDHLKGMLRAQSRRRPPAGTLTPTPPPPEPPPSP